MTPYSLAFLERSPKAEVSLVLPRPMLCIPSRYEKGHVHSRSLCCRAVLSSNHLIHPGSPPSARDAVQLAVVREAPVPFQHSDHVGWCSQEMPVPSQDPAGAHVWQPQMPTLAPPVGAAHQPAWGIPYQATCNQPYGPAPPEPASLDAASMQPHGTRPPAKGTPASRHAVPVNASSIMSSALHLSSVVFAYLLRTANSL